MPGIHQGLECTMTIPIWMLVGFAAWTALLLTFTVGVYRWKLIFARRMAIADFPADRIEGADWYLRSMRAHANCIENLPVFGAIVFALHVGNVHGPIVDYLSVAILLARMVQSSVHVCFRQTNRVVAVRFSFFSVQLLGFLALIGILLKCAL
jgi:uncharacterized MAPEG superfamily protein